MREEKELRVNYNEEHLTPNDRLVKWLKNNLENIALVFICAVYVLRGVFTIETSNKTVLEILADGAVSLVGAFLIKAVLDKKGILKGLIAPKFIATTNAYGKKKTEIADFVEELFPFCNMSNAERLKQKQKEFLFKYALSYEKFIKGEYNDDPKYKTILKECRAIKVFEYTPTLLTNAYDNAKDETELLTATIQKYERTQRVGDIIIGVVFFLLFGYFAPGKNQVDAANTLWYALQVSMFLAIGMTKYMNSYYFITEKLRGKINRVIDILDEFINTRKKNPGIFKVDYNVAEKQEQVIDNKTKDKLLTERPASPQFDTLKNEPLGI